MPYIYDFDAGHTLSEPVRLLGNKGAKLSEMTRLGLPVPPGFTLTTDACLAYEESQTLSPSLKAEVLNHLETLGTKLGRFFGQEAAPLLISVRSGASVSMPGMMETLLNVGLTSTTLTGFASLLGDRAAALDCYRRFLQMYGTIVRHIPAASFQSLLKDHLIKHHLDEEKQLGEQALSELVAAYEALVQKEERASLGLLGAGLSSGQSLSSDPYDYLWESIEAVFKSWHSPRAKRYRQLKKIPETLGTAVTLQAMVFGNLSDQCASGVAFTRHPSTGEKVLFGEYLVKAQGEDVVGGTHTPTSLADGPKSMRLLMPGPFQKLKEIAERLEKHYKEMQDLEFTVEQGRLWMLQTRTGKRSIDASVRMAVEMVGEGLITRQEALLRVEPTELERLLLPCLDLTKMSTSLDGAVAFAQGFAGAPGAASGALVFTAEEAVVAQEAGESVILVRPETMADDVHGIWASAGILTEKGGTTSHAAVVARGMGKPCIVGASMIEIFPEGLLKVSSESGEVLLKKGDIVTLDGHTGKAYVGDLPRTEPKLTQELSTLMQWADQYRTLGVRANAETVQDVRKALELGAEGIGLCRTEHMFFDPQNLRFFQKMILSEGTQERQRAIDALLPLQRKNFEDLLEALDGKPITIRFLDPPLHEFMPSTQKDLVQVSKDLGRSSEDIQRRRESLQELNPMLGHRGCRLAISFPALYAMQARAIFEAAATVQKRGMMVALELMVPLISSVKEMAFVREVVEQAHAEVEKEQNVLIAFTYGCMIETPRAVLQAEKLAHQADFFSFGTNDLTQLTYGLSRDDFAPFWPSYEAAGVFAHNPFVSLDQRGVGELIQDAIERGRQGALTRESERGREDKAKKSVSTASFKIGICGEHGGDPSSIHFFHTAGLDYVSCSPYRVLCARLAAAQAAL